MNKNKILFVLQIVCGLASILSLCVFLPCVRTIIINLGESTVGRPVNYEMWYATLPKIAVVFILYNLCVIMMCHFPYHLLFPSDMILPYPNKYQNEIFPLFFLFMTAFVVLSICSTCSYLYPYNIWVDSNCYHSVGKAFWVGKVFYRDIYDHKGPLLYFIHSLATLIFYRTFIGVFIFEVIAATFFLFYMYKTVMIFVTKNVLFLLPLMAMAIYASPCFVFGDSAEEFCLPFIMYPMYLSVRHLVEQSKFKPTELIVTGIMAGCVLWVKFSLLGFFLGWAVIPVVAYSERKYYVGIIQAIGFVFFGVLIATIPWIIYFGVHGAIGDWLSGYIIDNIFLYPTVHNELLLPFAVTKSFLTAVFRNPLMFLLIFISFVTAFNFPNKRLGVSLALQFGVSFLLIFGTGRVFRYSSFIFAPFITFSLIPIVWFWRCLVGFIQKDWMKKMFWYSVLPFASLLAFFLSPNTQLFSIPKNEYPQYKITEYIQQYENPSLLNYGCLDTGIYTTTGIVPFARFHHKPNLPKPEIVEEQNLIVNEGLSDFLVTSKPIDLPLYTLVMHEKLYNLTEEGFKNYYLYKNKNLF